jgi:ubiquinone/menaquinone biosynthesis C-methylase UbiE
LKIAHSDYDEIPVRAKIGALARRYGGPALDIGTGACACMALALARDGLQVTAVDYASSAVRIAQERAVGELADRLEVCFANAAHLLFPDGSHQIVVAFDVLCHTADPAAVLSEMFRVCAGGGVVIVAELNGAGREITRHRDGGFEKGLPDLLARYCQDCQRLEHPYHVTFVCERS